jgi:hypothetical protein
MKKPFLFISILSLFLFQACIGWGSDDDIIEPEPFNNYEPVVMQRTAFETTTIFESTPRTIENSGKIYVKDDFIFINEVNKGFHIINNSNPSNPANIGFVQVLGSSDLSIKGNVFYANNATDLIAFTIDENNQSLTITKRLENVFPQIWTPDGPGFYNVALNEIIIDWELIN